MMRMAITAGLVAVAGAALAAGWDTNCWPLYEHPRQYGMAESNLVDQVNARGSICGGGASVSWWRTRSGNLATIKTAIKGMVPGWSSYGWGYHWVRQDVITNPVYWLNASNALPTYTQPKQVLEECRLPTNFLDYTPWRDLSGIGGFTNDLAAVGRPHGVTNQYTVRGGTNYPSGRTCWYTMDYGIDGCKAFLEKLTTVNPYHSGYTRRDSAAYSGYSSFNDDLSTAQANALANFQYVGAGYPYIASANVKTLDDRFYSAALKSGRALMWCGDLQPEATNFSMTARGFFVCQVVDDAFGFVVTGSFDAQGSGYQEGWNEIADVSLTNDPFPIIEAWVGSTNAATVWPVNVTYTWNAVGWEGMGDYCGMVTFLF